METNHLKNDELEKKNLVVFCYSSWPTSCVTRNSIRMELLSIKSLVGWELARVWVCGVLCAARYGHGDDDMCVAYRY